MTRRPSQPPRDSGERPDAAGGVCSIHPVGRAGMPKSETSNV
jgi:hypothetical protein